MLIAVDHVPVRTNPVLRESRLFPSVWSYVGRNAVSIFRVYSMYEPLRVFSVAAIVLGLGALGAWMPFLIDWIFNGDTTGHMQSLILGAVLSIAAVQVFALGVVGDILAGQRVITQRVFERVRRIELQLGVEPTHYHEGEPEREPGPPMDGAGGAAGRTSACRGAQLRTAASLLSIGVGATGLVTYLYFAIASHELSKTDYGEIAVLWSAVFITVSTLQRPIEQLLSRDDRRTAGARASRSRQAMRVAADDPVGRRRRLRGRRADLAGPAPERPAVRQRDPLLGLRRRGDRLRRQLLRPRLPRRPAASFALFTALILSESIFRTLFALARRDRHRQRPVGGGARDRRRALPEPDRGPARLHPAQKRRPQELARHAPDAKRRTCRRDPSSVPPGTSAISTLRTRPGGGFAAAVLVIMFSEQAFLNAGPLIARGLQGAAAAGFIFNVLMIARAPLQLFQAVSTSILPHLTSLHTSTDPDSDREFHKSVRMVLLGVAAFAAFTAVVVLIAGPQLMQIAFSKKFTYDREGLLLVTLGMGLYLGSVTLNQACLAQGQVRRAAARWLLCAAFFIGWNFLPFVDNEFRRVEFGFALTAGLLFALLYLIYRRPHERAEDIPEPDSPEELEARLASIDENV